MRLCDLGVRIEGTKLEKRIERLYDDLARRRVAFRPHVWLSTEWFTPDGVPGLGVPFYLVHPRLMKLEEKQMYEVEGGHEEWCMRLLRHETGHAIDNAYRLHRRKQWREIFGPATRAYPSFYQPRPYSKRYVLHLDYWYAQGHPCEDFAETFAVWLTPGVNWRKRYAGWPALRKLEYVDALMKEIARKKPAVTTRERTESLPKLRMTLREYYEDKRARYGTDYPDFYDRDLRRLFADRPSGAANQRAAAFLRRIRPEIRRLVSRWTGQYQYTIDQLFRELITRSRQLNLRLDRTKDQAKLEAAILLTVQTMNYLHSGHHRISI